MAHYGRDAKKYIGYNRNKMRCDEIRNGIGFAQSNHPIGKKQAISVAKDYDYWDY